MEDGSNNNTNGNRKPKRKATATCSMQMMEKFTTSMDKTMDQAFTTMDQMAKAFKVGNYAEIAGRLSAFELIEVCEKKLKDSKEEERNNCNPDTI